MSKGSLVEWLGIQRSGYQAKSITSDISLGVISGVDYVLWCYAFASMVFIGALSESLPLAVFTILIANGFLTLWISLTSKLSVHLATIQEQGVAIIATIAIAMNGQISGFEGPMDQMLTIYAIMVLSCFLFAISFYATSYFKLHQLIQLIPYPVVCGFLAGIGWLLFDTAYIILLDEKLSFEAISSIFSIEEIMQWAPAFIGGIILVLSMRTKYNAYALLFCLAIFLLAFHLIANIAGYSMDELREQGWLFNVAKDAPLLDWQAVENSSVNFSFILSVIPEILTLLFICLLSAFFNFSALETVERKPIDLKHELKHQSVANIVMGFFGGMPGYTDIAGTTIYKRVGSGSRWMGITAGLVCALVAVIGVGFVTLMPKLVIGAMIFMFAFVFFNDWLVRPFHQVSRMEYMAILAIFTSIVFIGFMPGIVIGIAISSLLFIVRYARISIVSSSYSLKEHNSSVDRAMDELKIIQEKGRSVHIYSFRGFLFFGSANRFYDTVKSLCQSNDEPLKAIIFNFNNVSGIDSTAGQVFFKLVQYLDGMGTKSIFCGLSVDAQQTLERSDVFNEPNHFIFPFINNAMAFAEDMLLPDLTPNNHNSIEDIFYTITGNKLKSQKLAKLCKRIEYKKDDYLFRQGDGGSDLFIIQKGCVVIELETPSGVAFQVREFREGTVIGEMAYYTDHRVRSASARALEPCVIYQIDPENLRGSEKDGAIFHEFSARLLVTRINFMNRRLMIEN